MTIQQLTPSQIDQCRRCIIRELNKRKWFYPKWIGKGKMTQEQADFEIETMELVKSHFDWLQIHTKPLQQKLF